MCSEAIISARQGVKYYSLLSPRNLRVSRFRIRIRTTLTSVMGAAKSAKLTQTPDRFYKAKVGRFGQHTHLLYNGRVKLHANVLCQLRSGINRLNKYLAKINAVETEQCKCNRGEESVDHFLFRCPRWSNFRGEMRRLAGQRWGDTSYLLGGWSGEQKDRALAKWRATNRDDDSHY